MAIKTSCFTGSTTIRAATLLLGILTSAPSVLAQGTVLPATARPHGYSLTEAAAATAIFNTTFPRTLDNLPQKFPFQILYIEFDETTRTIEVKPGTTLYVPIVFSDNSEPILGDFPDVNDHDAVADYYFSQEQLGAESIEIEVDGKVTSLDSSYVVGAEAETAFGTEYTAAAVFLTPLPPGTHTVTIRARFTGDALAEFPEFFPGGVWEFETTYTVIVR